MLYCFARRSSLLAVPALGASLMLTSFATSAHADLAHRYSFTSDASDSVGGADGNVVDAGANVNHAFVGGQLDLANNPNEGSNGIVEGAYVDLPNGIISTAAQDGVNGAVSFEMWATVSETRTWQRFWDFGTSNDGEDTSASGTNSAYVLATPNSGRWTNGLEITNHPASNAAEPNVGVTGPFANGVEAHIVAVYDHNDLAAGPNGTMTLYFDGSAIGANQIHPDIDLRTFTDNNNWLGRSQWNDSLYSGSYNEFRVYSHALSAAAVAASKAAGPDQVIPEAGTAVLATLASLTLGGRRRRTTVR